MRFVQSNIVRFARVDRCHADDTRCQRDSISTSLESSNTGLYIVNTSNKEGERDVDVDVRFPRSFPSSKPENWNLVPHLSNIKVNTLLDVRDTPTRRMRYTFCLSVNQ